MQSNPLNPASRPEVPVDELLIQMETAALERWNHGDPSGYLEITAPDVVYLDPVQRLEGLDQLTALYETARGLIEVDSYEMLHPRVHATGHMAALSFQLLSRSGNTEQKWNCTEVYRLDDEGWKIVQTHWSKAGV